MSFQTLNFPQTPLEIPPLAVIADQCKSNANSSWPPRQATRCGAADQRARHGPVLTPELKEQEQRLGKQVSAKK